MSYRTMLGNILVAVGVVWGRVDAYGQSALENPQPSSIQSGVGLVSGWKCTGGDITARFNGGSLIPVVYGSPRGDTVDICGDENNGFALLWNWALLGEGVHTIELFDNDVLFASATFTVVTTGVEFLTGASASCTIADFPSSGDTATVSWVESLQDFQLTSVSKGGAVPNVAGTWLVELDFLTEDCNFLSVPPDFPTELTETLNVFQNGAALTAISGSVTFTGEVESDGDFSLVGPLEVNTTDACTWGLIAGYGGNFLENTLVFVRLADQISGTCTGLSFPCSVAYAGTIIQSSSQTAGEEERAIATALRRQLEDLTAESR